MPTDIPSNSYLRNDISKFSIDFNIPEAQTSNLLVSGANKTGKSRLSAGICSILQTINWKIIAFDNTGIWKKISDIPIFYMVRKARNLDEESKMRCQYCNKPISKEEYERERHGYCDECSDDLATEEETEDVWRI